MLSAKNNAIAYRGRVRFNKSEISNEPCPIYFVESGDSSLLIENCDEQAFVEFK